MCACMFVRVRGYAYVFVSACLHVSVCVRE